LFDDPIRYYTAMLDDIESAKEQIYLQTYRIHNDSIGIRFREALTAKAKQGLEIKLLLDSWGSSSLPDNFFARLVKHGGEVRYFEKIKLNIDFFTRSHKRNHRKILLIDNKVSYIGSTNLTDYNLNWRELVLRMEGDVAMLLKRVFKRDFRFYNKYVFDKYRAARTIYHEDFEIIRDVPSLTIKRISKRYIHLIKLASKSIFIETPYFLPGFKLRKSLMDAAKRGVTVKVIIPKHSDVGLVDILRNKYLGPLHQSGIRFLYYLPNNLHAKTLLIDDEVFSIGSSNFDYRSFRYMYEVTLIGRRPDILAQLKTHIDKTIQNSEDFNIQGWLNRPKINRFFEWLLLPFRHLL
jgi:cardiolipin synthase A/B